jgi:hypothetical protein
MNKTMTLTVEDWRTLLEFAGRMAEEIAEFDDEDEEYVAVRAVLTNLEEQLPEHGVADTPYLVSAPTSAKTAS